MITRSPIAKGALIEVSNAIPSAEISITVEGYSLLFEIIVLARFFLSLRFVRLSMRVIADSLLILYQ